MRSALFLLVTIPVIYSISVPLNHNSANLYCPTQELNYWNAIIFNRFQVNNTNLDRGIDGALIAGSKSSIYNYKINHQTETKECTSNYNESIPVQEYGLYANTEHLDHVDVNGAVQLNHFRPISRINQIGQSCRLKTAQSDTDLIQHYKSIAKDISSQFANQKPTHVLQKNGSVVATGTQHPDFNFINFASCVNQVCKDIAKDTYLSDPALVFSKNNTKDVHWPSGKPVVFNVPVIQGTSVELNNVLENLTACQTIWNFFPVDKLGNVVSKANTTFTINRTTKQPFEGIILAVDGTIRDGSEGGFAGQLVANNYEWIDKNNGTSIRSFRTSCNDACWPKKLTATTTEYIVEKADLMYAHSQYVQDHSMQPQAFFDQDAEVFTLCAEDYEKYKDYLREQIPCDYRHIKIKTEEKELTNTVYANTQTLTLRTREINDLTLPYKELNTVFVPVISQSYTSTSVSEIRYTAQVEPLPTTLVRFNLVHNALQTLVAH